jgi:outer membrane protein assembly factor BamB
VKIPARSIRARSRTASVHATAIALLAFTSALALSANAFAATSTNYTAYLGGPAHTSYAADATSFTTANAAAAHPIWNWSPVRKGKKSTYLDASPITNNGIVYIGAETGDFYAITAATGSTKWRKKLPDSDCNNSGIVSSATVAPDPITGTLTVYVGAGDHYLYALNAATGATIWRTRIGENDPTYYNWSSPTVADGYVYYGVSTACDVAGYDGVVALNQETGVETGVYYTSGSATVEGASVHTSVAVADDGSVFVSTGNDNGASTTDSTAIVKLAEGSLTRLDGYQIPGLVGQNLDFMASPTLFTAGLTPMVGACDKNGTFYALRQADLTAPVWTTQLGTPPTPQSLSFCGDAAAYDGAHLFVGANFCAASMPTCTNTTAPGSMYELDPTTGAIVWYTALSSGPVVGGVSLDGSRVLAVPTYNITSGAQSAVYLMNSATGAILRTIRYRGPIFSQPVFANGALLIAGPSLQAYLP